MRAYFLQRLGAYLIDVVLVVLAVSLIATFFPENNNLVKLNQEMKNLTEEYLEGEISAKDYLVKSSDINYDIAYQQVFLTIMNISAFILYFIIFQYYNKGQTVGKKLLKIRTTRIDGKELQINDLALRSLVAHSLLIDMILLAVILFANREVYFYSSNILEVLQSIVLIVTVIMVIYRKDGRGLHDLVGNTIVVLDNPKKELVVCEEN